jgi:hypothetical protein
LHEIFKAIATYADAYKSLELIQRRVGSMLPIGDQKTGVIGEFYARLYAASIYKNAELVYGHASEHAWDIKVRQQGREDHKIQVKTVSAHSATSRVSRIHPGWHELYLLRLDQEFLPVGFWALHVCDASWGLSTLAASTMPRRERFASCSRAFKGCADRLDEFLTVLRNAQVASAAQADRNLATA